MEDLFRDDKFGEGNVLVKNFLLMAFADTRNKLYLDLVGTSIDMKTLIVYASTTSSLNYVCVFRYTHDKEICTVIPADYYSLGQNSYLIVSKDKGEYENNIVPGNTDHVRALERTSAVPLLLSYQDARPALLMQTKKRCYVLKFTRENGVSECEMQNISLPNMHPLHTSAFVDVTGDLLADLVLETQRKNGRCLEVFENRENAFVKSDELWLPNDIGPLCFANFHESSFVDVTFVSKENGAEYLNVFFNSRAGSKCFSDKLFIKIPLDNLIPGYGAVISRADIGMPAGIFVADLFGNSVPHIIVTMKDHNSDAVRHVLFKNLGKGDFEPDIEVFAGLPNRKIVSLCLADISNAGAEGILLNYYENGNYLLTFYENTLAATKGYYIRAMTCEGNRPGDDHGCALPGVSYKYRHIENETEFFGFQLAQSSFPHLKHPFAFFGLGSVPCLVELEGVGLPFYKEGGKVFTICQKIIPNSQLLLQPQKNEMKVRLNFFAVQNIQNVMLTLILVMFANLVILSVLYVKNRRKETKKGEDILFDFEAL